MASDSEEKNYKKAAVITGSASDLLVVEEAVRMLKEYGSIIAAAGMTAHLSGNMRVYKDGQYIDPITFPRLFFA